MNNGSRAAISSVPTTAVRKFSCPQVCSPLPGTVALCIVNYGRYGALQVLLSVKHTQLLSVVTNLNVLDALETSQVGRWGTPLLNDQS